VDPNPLEKVVEESSRKVEWMQILWRKCGGVFAKSLDEFLQILWSLLEKFGGRQRIFWRSSAKSLEEFLQILWRSSGDLLEIFWRNFLEIFCKSSGGSPLEMEKFWRVYFQNFWRASRASIERMRHHL
jgi:hypothetical protein